VKTSWVLVQVLEEVGEGRQLEELQLVVREFQCFRIVASDCTGVCGDVRNDHVVLDSVDNFNLVVHNLGGYHNC
jgi:hypothetical protein